jgi:hypothetical protein
MPIKRRWRENAVAYATITGAVIGLVALGVAIGDRIVTQRSNVESQRAYLFVDGVRSKKGTTDTSRSFVAIQLVNRGKTATKDLNTRFTCLASPFPIDEPWSYLKEPKEVKSPSSEVVGIGGSTHVVCAFDKDHFRWIAEGKAFGYLVLNATYRDRLDDTVMHRLQWSQRITYASKEPDEQSGYNLTLQPHGKHNCADDECPE